MPALPRNLAPRPIRPARPGTRISTRRWGLRVNPMNDDLRTRITAVIYNELREQSDRDTAFPVMVGPAVGSPNFNGVALIDGEVDLDAAADAVIRELGLRMGDR